MGLFDDLAHVKPGGKLLGQAITASLVFFSIGKLDSFYGFLGDFDIPYTASFCLTVFTIIIITNSFNLIDGIDGLAGAFAALSLIFLGTWFYLIGHIGFSILCFALLGAVGAFLIFNWEPSRIFMGNTGAQTIGMMLSILIIEFIRANAELPDTSLYKFQAGVSTAIAVVILPVTDTVRIIIIRLSKGISPLVADKRHIHHCLVALGLRHQQAVIFLMTIYSIFLLIAVLLRTHSDVYVFSVILVLATMLCLILDRFKPAKAS